MPPFSQDVLLILLLVVSGFLAGYTGGLFGIGGGIVLVPTLLTIFSFFPVTPQAIMHCVVGTSLALVIPTGWVSAHRQNQQHNLNLVKYFQWIPGVIVGSVMGVFVVSLVDTTVLKWVFAIYLYCCILFTFFKRQTKTHENAGPHGIVKIGGGLVIGCFSIMLGVGGGTFTVPFFNAFNYPLKSAIALASSTGVAIGIIGAIGVIISGWGEPGRMIYSLGYVNVIAFIIVTPVLLISAPLGVRTANHLTIRQLKWIYIIFLFVVAAYMTFQVLAKPF